MPSYSALPTDPLLCYQWGLLNTGQAYGGIDIDVGSVWADYTGTGLKVAVIVDGTQLDQPDLVANIEHSWDAALDQPGENPVSATQNYGTATAGIIAAADVDPLQHYLDFGWKEGRDPSAAFSTNDYLQANPDVKAAGLDPMVQYLQSGAAEGRSAIPVLQT